MHLHLNTYAFTTTYILRTHIHVNVDWHVRIQINLHIQSYTCKLNLCIYVLIYIYTFQFTETYTFTSKCAFQNFPVDLYCPHFRQSETVIVSELKKEVSNRGSETFNFCPDNSSTMFAFVGRRSASLSSYEISLRSGNDFVQVMGVFPPPLNGAKIMGDFLIHCVSFGADQIAGNRIFHSFPYSSQFHQCTPTVA